MSDPFVQKVLGDAITEDQKIANLAGEMGDDVAAVKQQMIKENNDQLKAFKAKVEQDTGGIVNTAADVAQGVGAGFGRVILNIQDGLLQVKDMITGSKTQKLPTDPVLSGPGGPILERQDLETADKLLNGTGIVARGVSEFVAPVVASTMVGGGFAAGVAADTAYGFLAQDPDGGRLSQHLAGTGLAEIPAVANWIKPGDTELEKRTKNAVESFAVSLPLSGLVYGVSRLFKNAKEAKAIATGTAEEVPVRGSGGGDLPPAVPSAAPTKMAGGDQPFPKTLAEREKVIAANEARIAELEKKNANFPEPLVVQEINTQRAAEGLPPQTAQEIRAHYEALAEEKAQLDLFEKQWATLGNDDPIVKITQAADGTEQVRVKLQDGEIWPRFRELAEAYGPDRFRVPMTDDETRAVAAQIKNDPGVVERIANWKPGDPVPADTDAHVLHYILQQADESLAQSFEAVAGNPSPENLVRLVRDMEGHSAASSILTGTASESAARLRAEQILGRAAQMGDKEALAQIGSKGRANLFADLVQAYGGPEKLQKMANQVDFIRKAQAIQRMGDNAFMVGRKGAVVPKTTLDKFEEGLTTIAFNSMLGLKPLYKAIVSNAGLTATQVVEDFLLAATPGSSKTMKELNAQLQAMWAVKADALSKAVAGFKDPASVKNIVRLDAAPGFQVKSFADAAEKSMWSILWDKGINLASGYQIPTRLLVSSDAFFHELNKASFIMGRAHYYADEAIRAGAIKPQQAGDFIERMVAAPPRSLIEQADSMAGGITMSKPLTGIPERVNDTISAVPFGKLLIPFTSTGFNSVEYSIKHSPFALRWGTVATAIREGGRAEQEALAKVAVGTSAMGVFMGLAMHGLVKAQDEDFQKSRERSGPGEPPSATAIKVGDKWIAIDHVDPIANFIDVGAKLSKLSGYMSDEEYSQAVHTGVSALLDLMSPQQMIETTGRLVDLVKGDPKAAPRAAADVLLRLQPLRSTTMDVREQFFDDRVVMTDKGKINTVSDWWNMVKARMSSAVPGITKDMPAHQNVWGEDLKLPDGIGPDSFAPISVGSEDSRALKPILEKLDHYAEVNASDVISPIRLGMPSSVITMADGNRIQLTPNEYARLVKYTAGVDANGKRLQKEMPSLKEAVNAVFKKHGLFEKDISKLTEQEYTTVSAQVRKIVGDRVRMGRAMMAADPGLLRRLNEEKQ